MDSNTEPPQVDANDLTNKLHSQLLLKHTGLHKIIINKKKKQSHICGSAIIYKNYYLKDSRLPRPLNGAATSSRSLSSSC